jgi:hypothetical protein
MHRTNAYLESFNLRIQRLENQSTHAPSDEQVERVLRKILAEKFSGGITQHVQSPDTLKEEDCFADAQKELANFKPIQVDTALLLVDPDAVPSKAYEETMKMLDGALADYPRFDRHRAASPDKNSTTLDYNSRQPKSNGF